MGDWVRLSESLGKERQKAILGVGYIIWIKLSRSGIEKVVLFYPVDYESPGRYKRPVSETAKYLKCCVLVEKVETQTCN